MTRPIAWPRSGRCGPRNRPRSAGRATIRYDFAYDGGGHGKGGTGTLSVNGRKVAEGRIANTHANIVSGDETADVGVDEATAVTEDYKEHDNTFTGTIHKVTIEAEVTVRRGLRRRP